MSINIPDFFAIRNAIALNFIDVFGTDINTDPNSPTGQLIDLLANSYLQLYQLLQAVDLSAYAQQAQGQSLDNLLALINVFRPIGTRTIIPNVTLTGIPTTIIPAGSQAQTSSGNLFFSASNATIGGGGTALVDFLAQDFGAIVVDINQLNTIVTDIPGWTQVINGSPGITGLDRVPDAILRRDLPRLVNQYSLGYQGAIRARIFQNDAVKDVFIYENDTVNTAPPPFNSPRNSLFIILYYKDETQEQEIAISIFNSKSAVSVYSENNPQQVIKEVTDISGTIHQVSWNKAIEVPIYIEVKIQATSQLTVDVSELIKDTLTAYINDDPKIGQTLFYNRFLCSVADLNDNFEVEDFWVTITPPPNSSNVVDLVPSFNEVFTLDRDNVTITLL